MILNLNYIIYNIEINKNENLYVSKKKVKKTKKVKKN